MEEKVKTRPGPKPIDLSGQKFGRLTAVSYEGRTKWSCVCECGNSASVPAADLKRERVRSCGCLQLEVAKSGDCRRIHGRSGTPEYRSWKAMINRCTNPDAAGYHRYGGRGISVCERWLSDFMAFYEDMGPRPSGTTLDRINFDGNYEPSNCRWASDEVQSSNTSRAILVSANGKTQTLEAWSRELGVSNKAIRYRLSVGMSHHDVVNTPFRKHKRH